MNWAFTILGFILACLLVGLAIITLLSAEGRGCLGTLFGLAFTLIAIVALGAVVIVGGMLLLVGLVGLLELGF